MIGIDPGVNGGVGSVDKDGTFLAAEILPMATTKDVDIPALLEILESMKETAGDRVTLEIPRCFGMPPQKVWVLAKIYTQIEIALQTSGTPYSLVDSSKWSKEIHDGIDPRLKAKEKSKIAVRQLFPGVDLTPTEKSKKVHDGMMDALLIAEYGRRKLK